MQLKLIPIIILLFPSLFLQSCENKTVEFFSLEDEKFLAQELLEWVSDDSTFTILSPVDYAISYTYANTVLTDVLGLDNEDSINSPINYLNEFDWQVFIIHDASLSAFITPGGHVYVTSGILNLMDNVDEFASLLAHLIAHADNRHVTRELLNHLTSMELKQASSGTNSQLLSEVAERIFGKRITFNFSQANETESESFAVEYLYHSNYSCNASISFNQKLEKQFQQGNPPSFQNLHPNSINRADIINKKATSLDCDTDLFVEGGFTYTDFKNSLP